MHKYRPRLRSTALTASLIVLATTGIAAAAPIPPTSGNASGSAGRAGSAPIELAQARGEERGELRPRYEPVPPRHRSNYNNEYIFGLTRGVADSTMHPAAKILVFPITVPLDIALLPFEVIGGFFQ